MRQHKTIRIGTRGSKLALFQANATKKAIEHLHTDYSAEVIIIKTKGDIILDKPLAQIGDKGLFTKELENELYSGNIDIAVHSLKDLPTLLPERMKIGAVLPRAEFRDALVSKDKRKLHEFNAGDTFATSSLRRRASLLSLNPDFHIVDIRGNVETRLRKMYDGHCDAMIMAAAGLQRLGLDEHIAEIIEPGVITPAVSQGAIAIEVLEDFAFDKTILEGINHEPTWLAVKAERSFLHTLQGGCQVPMGCYSEVVAGSLSLIGFVSTLNGKTMLKEKITGRPEDGTELGKQLAEKLQALGATEILDNIRKQQESQ